MSIVETDAPHGKHSFHRVAQSFLQPPGLPFAQALTAEDIEAAFAEQDGLFGQDDMYSTQLVLWAFLAQVARGGKGGACAAAVADIATYLQQTGGQPPAGDTGDYCRARAKLSRAAVRNLTVQTAQQLEQDAAPAWLWRGLHAKLIDGFTFTLPDTLENQRAFPQQKNQRPGAGFPIARACAVLSLATAACRDAQGLWHQALARIAANAVADRPGRIEPRMIKRRRDHYPLMHDPRTKLRPKPRRAPRPTPQRNLRPKLRPT